MCAENEFSGYGNAAHFGGEVDTGEPFLISVDSESGMLLIFPVDGQSHTVSISKQTLVAKKIDNEYIPQQIPYIDFNAEFHQTEKGERKYFSHSEREKLQAFGSVNAFVGYCLLIREYDYDYEPVIFLRVPEKAFHYKGTCFCYGDGGEVFNHVISISLDGDNAFYEHKVF